MRENRGIAFMGDTKGGRFDVPGDLAREWLQLPLNPNGRPNSDVVAAMDERHGSDAPIRPDRWIIDFGWEMSEREAALYEAPFASVSQHVRPSATAEPARGVSTITGGGMSSRGPACGAHRKG